MKAVVVGATGNIGRRVVSGLLDQGVEVRATTRNPEKANIPGAAEVFGADLETPSSLAPALAGADAVFLYGDADDARGLAQVVAESGVRRAVLLSSWAAAGVDAEHDFNGARFWRAEQALGATRVQTTFVRPGTFASNAARWRWDVVGRHGVPLPYPTSLVAPVHEQDVADIGVLAMTSDELAGQAPILTGPTVMTLADQVHQIGDAIGQPLEVLPQTDAEARASLARFLPPAWANFIVDTWREAVDNPPAVSTDYERITGRPARSFAQWAVDNAALFRAA